MNMSGKFGNRKNTRISKTDFHEAHRLSAQLHKLLTTHSDYVGMKLPKDYPKLLNHPGIGTTADERGRSIMIYTLYLTKLAFKLLNHVDKRHDFKYKIERLEGVNHSSHHVRAYFKGTANDMNVSSTYLVALIWVLETLNTHVDNLKKRI